MCRERSGATIQLHGLRLRSERIRPNSFAAIFGGADCVCLEQADRRRNAIRTASACTNYAGEYSAACVAIGIHHITAVAALAIKRGKSVDFSVVNFAQIGEGRR